MHLIWQKKSHESFWCLIKFVNQKNCYQVPDSLPLYSSLVISCRMLVVEQFLFYQSKALCPKHSRLINNFVLHTLHFYDKLEKTFPSVNSPMKYTVMKTHRAAGLWIITPAWVKFFRTLFNQFSTTLGTILAAFFLAFKLIAWFSVKLKRSLARRTRGDMIASSNTWEAVTENKGSTSGGIQPVRMNW